MRKTLMLTLRRRQIRFGRKKRSDAISRRS